MKFKNLIEEIKACEYEVKSLEEIADAFKNGVASITGSTKNNGNYPCIIQTDIFESQIYVDEHKTFVDLDSIKIKTFVEKGDILIAWSGYSKKNNKEGFCTYLKNNKPLAGNNIYVLKHSQDGRYLAYSLSSNLGKKQFNFFLNSSLSGVLWFSLKEIKKIKIPILSLDLQEKIGSFLFRFTEYEKILKREMERRRKQFHYYREKIFGRLIEKCELRNEEYWRYCIRNIFWKGGYKRTIGFWRLSGH